MGKDTRRLVIGMVLSLGVLFGWQKFMAWKWPEWYAQQNQPIPPAAPAPAPTPAGTPATTSTVTHFIPGTATAPTGTWRARGADAYTGPTLLGDAAPDAKDFAMAVSLDPRGAAIDSVVLNAFRKTAEDKNTRYSFQQPYVVDGLPRDDTRSLQTRVVSVNGLDVDVTNVAWKLLPGATPTTASYSVDVLNGETPVARVVKTFTLSKRSDDDPKTPQGYELSVAQRVENLTGQPAKIRLGMNGPTAPPRELEGQPDQNFIFGYGYDDGHGFKVSSHPLASEFSKDHVHSDFAAKDSDRQMQWVGAQSAYFNAIARPVPPAANQPAPWLSQVTGDLLNPANEHVDEHRVTLRFDATVDVPAGGAADVAIDAYFGPKGRKVLNTAYYAGAPRHYDETLVITADSGFAKFCAICTWQWLISVLVTLLTWFQFVTRDWGLAIIGLVLVVRALLHPITKRSQVHMVKMQKMGPEMEKLKKKFADDKEALQKAQVQFYKEQGFTPILGCLPMFLQMPIWIALWNSLQSTFELRHSPFLYGFTWIHDLSKPDYLVRFEHPYSFLFLTMRGINVLPLLMAVVMYFQAQMQPKPLTSTPEQEQQQKMMKWMSTLIFPLMLYSGPAGLNLYIMTSTLFGIIESKVIRRHIKEREALLAAAGPTIMDEDPPERGGGGGSKRKDEPKGPKPMGWLARLQERAEQIRNEAQKPKSKR